MPVPSYDLKLRRAEQHLVELERLVGAFQDSYAHEVRYSIEGKQNRWRLDILTQPDDQIILVLADVVYNIRSALDHVMACVAPSRNRFNVYFPIFYQGVWDPPIEGENEQRSEDREKWCSCVSGVAPEAVAFLKQAQPQQAGDDSVYYDGLRALNTLSNADRHRRLPHVYATLTEGRATIRTISGMTMTPWFSGRQGLMDGADLNLPKETVAVHLTGTPEVMVNIRRSEQSGARIPWVLRQILLVTGQILDGLRPFDRVNR